MFVVNRRNIGKIEDPRPARKTVPGRALTTDSNDNRKTRTSFLLVPRMGAVLANEWIYNFPASKTSPGQNQIAREPASLVEEIQRKHQVIASMTMHGAPPMASSVIGLG